MREIVESPVEHPLMPKLGLPRISNYGRNKAWYTLTDSQHSLLGIVHLAPEANPLTARNVCERAKVIIRIVCRPFRPFLLTGEMKLGPSGPLPLKFEVPGDFLSI